jgi:hypothetical protein
MTRWVAAGAGESPKLALVFPYVLMWSVDSVFRNIEFVPEHFSLFGLFAILIRSKCCYTLSTSPTLAGPPSLHFFLFVILADRI